jgi:hypothetical protein
VVPFAQGSYTESADQLDEEWSVQATCVIDQETPTGFDVNNNSGLPTPMDTITCPTPMGTKYHYVPSTLIKNSLLSTHGSPESPSICVNPPAQYDNNVWRELNDFQRLQTRLQKIAADEEERWCEDLAPMVDSWVEETPQIPFEDPLEIARIQAQANAIQAWNEAEQANYIESVQQAVRLLDDAQPSSATRSALRKACNAKPPRAGLRKVRFAVDWSSSDEQPQMAAVTRKQRVQGPRPNRTRPPNQPEEEVIKAKPGTLMPSLAGPRPNIATFLRKLAPTIEWNRESRHPAPELLAPRPLPQQLVSSIRLSSHSSTELDGGQQLADKLEQVGLDSGYWCGGRFVPPAPSTEQPGGYRFGNTYLAPLPTPPAFRS